MKRGIDRGNDLVDEKINEIRLRNDETRFKTRFRAARMKIAECERCKSNEVLTRTNPYRDRNFMRSRNDELTFSGCAILANPSLFPPRPLPLLPPIVAAAALVILIPHRGGSGGGSYPLLPFSVCSFPLPHGDIDPPAARPTHEQQR